MWKNNTSSVSVKTSTVLLIMALGASSATTTTDIVRSNTAVYQMTEKASLGGNGWKSKTNSIVSNTSDRLKQNLKKIHDISCLDNNWNDNGARAFSNRILSIITTIILSLNNQPEIFPTAANSIQIEYDGEEESYLEIEISESENASVYRINKDGSEDVFSIKADSESINRLVENFYG